MIQQEQNLIVKDTFTLDILSIQPTQLYISEDKLKAICCWIGTENNYQYDPIPIKRINDNIIFVDGHTRAFALYKLGIREIIVEWEPEEWDWEAYQICVDWCVESNIKSIADLDNRIINGADYESLWHDRCRNMQSQLEIKRNLIDSNK